MTSEMNSIHAKISMCSWNLQKGYTGELDIKEQPINLAIIIYYLI